MTTPLQPHATLAHRARAGRPRSLREVAQWAQELGGLDSFLREFLDQFYTTHSVDERMGMLADEPPLSADAHANAYLAAVAEHLARRNGLDAPAWTGSADRFLKRPFFPAGLESLKATLLAESPTAFRRRLIFVGADPLYRPRRDTSGVIQTKGTLPMMLHKDDILRGLRSLDAKARDAGVLVDMSIDGGAALALAFNIRQATRDVDAVVRGSPDFVRHAAAQVAAEEGWPEDWLNDGVKGFTSAHEKMRLMESFEGSPSGGLRIHTPAPEYLFAMKCMAMRPEGVEESHDISDIEALADEASIEDAEAALALVEAFYPASRIPPKVRFGVEEIMERVAARRAAAGTDRPTPA